MYVKNLMYFLYASLIIILSCSSAYATAQDNEIVFYEGRSYQLYNTLPLDSFYKNGNDRPKFQIIPDGWSTGNYRGYVGTWEIKDDRLYLSGIDSWIQKDNGSVRADLGALFGDRYIDGRVNATWFTGELRLRGGKIIIYTGGYDDIYELDIVIQIESGKVVSKAVIDNTKDGLLLNAANIGDLTDAQAALAEGADINTKKLCFSYGQTPLMAASHNGHTDVVKFLLEKGADVNAKNKYGDTALRNAVLLFNRAEVLKSVNNSDKDATFIAKRMAMQDASEKVHAEIVKLLLDKGADVNTKTDNGTTALIEAASRGMTEAVRLLLDRGADANVMATDGDTALRLAKVQGYAEIVQMLEKVGAKAGEDKNTELIWASHAGNLAAIQALLDQGADVNTKTYDLHETPLMIASLNGHAKAVELLLDRGAVLDWWDTNGTTSLMKASQNGDIELVRLLLDRGAFINKLSDKGWSSLRKAASRCHIEVVKLLLDRGADAKYCLVTAAESGCTELVKLLLEKGYDVNEKDHYGRAALILASLNGHSDVVRMLLDRDVDVNVRATDGTTALKAAKANWYSYIAQMLEKAGAKE
jgi:ankyrin repeat protein